MQKKKGISLIVLVITIIVMIILAAAVVVSLNNTGIINKANDAVSDTDLKQLEQLATLIWSEEFMSDKRGEILKSAVLEKLKDYTDEYDIEVTDKGVEVGKKVYNWPIIWNTMDVMNNYSVIIGDMSFVKIRDFIPSVNDFDSLAIAIPEIVIDGEVELNEERLYYTAHQQFENVILFSADEHPLAHVLVVTEAGKCESLGIELEETGIYVLNVGTLGVNVDFTIGPMLERPEISLENNMLLINTVSNATSYEIYINNNLISTTNENNIDLTNWLPNNKNAIIYVRALAKDGLIDSKLAACVSIVNMPAPGLYEKGSADLYYTFGATAIKEKMIKPWEQLLEEGYVNTDGSANENLELQGDLILTHGMDNIPIKAFCDVENITGVYIPEGCTIITEKSFCNCGSLETVIIPKTVKQIDSYAFSSSEKISSVKIAEDSQLEIIGDRAFSGCEKLADFSLPTTLKEIGEHAFYNAELKKIVIPESLTKLGNAAFSRCCELTEVSVAEDNSVYYATGNCIIEKASKKIVQGFVNSVIPSDGSVTTIGEYAFNNVFEEGLTDIVIPDSITHIERWAFYGNSYLYGINIPINVVYIGEYAFGGNPGLKKVTFANTNGWYCIIENNSDSKIEISSAVLSDTYNRAWQYLTNKYYTRTWYRN